MTANSGVSRTTVIVLGVGLIALSIVAVAGRAARNSRPPRRMTGPNSFSRRRRRRRRGSTGPDLRPAARAAVSVHRAGDRRSADDICGRGLAGGASDRFVHRPDHRHGERAERVPGNAASDERQGHGREKPLKIVIGDKIALTPPMGWNSWNCWAGSVDADKVLRAARAMVDPAWSTTAGRTSTSTMPGKARRGGEFQRHSAATKSFPT